ncbi:hypothetical protein SELMODRAFT_139075 [Selaginella moellendorffii]|uniref:Pentacotripeptide-repeat region of PRORP domain-containing protein n=2 Tax=Selaginella moellendorffii TaxID=88036 RepID=D8TGM1_SELML|nr:hypothetical protein SELMODRAFT_139075 [Selaginella moellendorffii]
MSYKDIRAWSAIVAAYSQNGHLSYSKKLFDEIHEPNVYSWTTLLQGYAENGCEEVAIELFQEMDLSGVEPDEVTFLGLLTALCQVGKLEDCLIQFASMSERGLRPSSEHYCCMVDALGRSGQVGEAERIINLLKRSPDSGALEGRDAAWFTLLGACRSQGDVHLGVRAAANATTSYKNHQKLYRLLHNLYAGS